MERDVRRLGRAELIEIIYQLQKSEQELQRQIRTLRDELDQRRIRIRNAGTLADAAAQVTELFDRAQKTADVYLEEIRCRRLQADEEYNHVVEMAHRQADALLQDAMRRRDEMDRQCREAQEDLRRMEQAAQRLRGGNAAGRESGKAYEK